MIFFGVSSPFTIVPLDYTIVITLKGRYDNKVIETKIGRKNVKNLLLLYTKYVHISLLEIFTTKKMVLLWDPPPLGPVLAGIFMLHLKRTLIPELEKFMKP